MPSVMPDALGASTLNSILMRSIALALRLRTQTELAAVGMRGAPRASPRTGARRIEAPPLSPPESTTSAPLTRTSTPAASTTVTASRGASSPSPRLLTSCTSVKLPTP